MKELFSPEETLPVAFHLLQKGISEGQHLGAQVFVSRQGNTLAHFAMGEASRGVPLKIDTLMPWMSGIKPIVAIALGRLWEQGRLDLDDPVIRHIPEFGAGGKERVTLRHVLTHTGAFPKMPVSSEGEQNGDVGQEILSAIYSMPLEPGWVPGRKACYHVLTGWYILGEIIHRLDGRSVELYVHEEIFAPLGMKDSWMALSPGQFAAYGTRIGGMHNTSGRRMGRQPDLLPWPTDSAGRSYWPSIPGRSGLGPISELGSFYEMLIQKGEYQGHRLLSPSTVEAMTVRHRVGMMDELFRHEMDWGLGFLLDSNRHGPETVPYGFGRHCSPRTFGHGGIQCLTSFADPENGLVVAAVFNGQPGEPIHNQRVREFNSAIYQDLGLL